jgi:hypothetical protein
MTVHGQRDKLKQGLILSALVGLDGPYSNDGPYPSFDHVGYKVAIQMLLMSRKKGFTVLLTSNSTPSESYGRFTPTTFGLRHNPTK